MYISIQIVASITERIASLLTVAETDELIVSVLTIVPSLIGYLAVTAFSTQVSFKTSDLSLDQREAIENAVTAKYPIKDGTIVETDTISSSVSATVKRDAILPVWYLSQRMRVSNLSYKKRKRCLRACTLWPGLSLATQLKWKR